VVFGAYGSGEAPVLSGLTSLTNWQPVGSNRWQTTCTFCGDRTDLLLLNGEARSYARYPNRDEGDEGYLYFDAAVGRSSLTDDALAAGSNWTGAELVIRSIAWVLDRYPIIGQQGGTLSLGPARDETLYDFEVGYGYFIQNHPAALDREGEWVYDAATKTITLYLSSDPNQQRIETATPGFILSLTNLAFVELRDLALHGGTTFALDILNCEGVRLTNLQVLHGAADGIQITNCTDLDLGYSHIHQHLTHGLRLWNCNACLVHHNRLESIGLLPGMGRGGDLQYNGVYFQGAQSVFEYNTLQDIGYNPVALSGAVTARYNLIQRYALVKVDSGALGTYYNRDSQIIGNIVLYGLGSDAAIPWGTPAVNGIYIDDNSEDILVQDNVVGYVGSNGIVLHNTRNIQVLNNTVFGAGEYGIIVTDDNLGSLESTDSLIQNNRVFGLGTDSAPLRVQTSLLGEDWLSRLGTLTNNRYCNPTRSNPVSVAFQPNWFTRELSLGGWQARYGYDAGSSDCGLRYPSHIESGTTGGNRLLNTTMESTINEWYGWPDSSLEMNWDARWGGSLRMGNRGNAPSVLVYQRVGGVEAGQVFRVRFRAQAETPDTAVAVYLQQAGPDYLWRSEPVRFLTDTVDRVYTVYVTATTADPDLRLTFDLPQSEQTVRLWVDDVEVIPVLAEPVGLEQVARLEVNPDTTPLSITLDNHAYRDLDGVLYGPGSGVTIPPYSGMILVREPLTPNATPVPPTPSATLTAAPPTPTLFPTPTVADYTVRMEPVPAAVRVGETVMLQMMVYGVTNLYGLEADCMVDPAVLRGEVHQPGTVFTTENSFFMETTPQADGRWKVGASLLNPAPAFNGTGLLFSMGYNAVGAGTTTITCTVLAMDGYGEGLPLQTQLTQLTVSG
jgi:hypothetical protein